MKKPPCPTKAAIPWRTSPPLLFGSAHGRLRPHRGHIKKERRPEMKTPKREVNVVDSAVAMAPPPSGWRSHKTAPWKRPRPLLPQSRLTGPHGSRLRQTPQEPGQGPGKSQCSPRAQQTLSSTIAAGSQGLQEPQNDARGQNRRADLHQNPHRSQT